MEVPDCAHPEHVEGSGCAGERGGFDKLSLSAGESQGAWDPAPQ